MAVSPEYTKLHQRLGDWFADDYGFGEPVIASRGLGRDEQLWEVRAGFVRKAALSLQGLAVVVRKRLPPREGLYRVDVYEPPIPKRLPPPDAMAGRILYSPNRATYCYSTNPDIVSRSSVPEEQYVAMNYLLDFVTEQPAAEEDTVAWVELYEQLP